MNTPAHVIFAAAAFARPGDRTRTAAAVLGALAPDLSLYVMTGWALFIAGYDPAYVFDTLYFSSAWQAVFAIDNSVFVWGAILVWAWRRDASNVMVFAASALMHLALDFPLHHDDGRPHFWPVTGWVFESPLSYWDVAHHATIIGPLEIVVSLICCGVLARRFTSVRSRLAIAALALTQASPAYFWAFVFSGGPPQ
ncbi:MAG: cobalamin biosynthesis protein CobQ [Pseudomonadota bacterium]